MDDISSTTDNGHIVTENNIVFKVEDSSGSTSESTICNVSNEMNIVNKIVNDMCDYLTDKTEFDYMQDEIINNRARSVMKNVLSRKILDTIDMFIDFLDTNEDILEHININGKIIYSIHNVEKNIINELIYDYLYDNIIYAKEFGRGWVNWNDNDEIFCNNEDFEDELKVFYINTMVKYVFEYLNTLMLLKNNDTKIQYIFIENTMGADTDDTAGNNTNPNALVDNDVLEYGVSEGISTEEKENSDEEYTNTCIIS
jgi:hypothetical protein